MQGLPRGHEQLVLDEKERDGGGHEEERHLRQPAGTVEPAPRCRKRGDMVFRSTCCFSLIFFK
jgi:hypothetical protein